MDRTYAAETSRTLNFVCVLTQCLTSLLRKNRKHLRCSSRHKISSCDRVEISFSRCKLDHTNTCQPTRCHLSTPSSLLSECLVYALFRCSRTDLLMLVQLMGHIRSCKHDAATALDFPVTIQNTCFFFASYTGPLISPAHNSTPAVPSIKRRAQTNNGIAAQGCWWPLLTSQTLRESSSKFH